jgi:hypothetical protein
MVNNFCYGMVWVDVLQKCKFILILKRVIFFSKKIYRLTQISIYYILSHTNKSQIVVVEEVLHRDRSVQHFFELV